MVRPRMKIGLLHLFFCVCSEPGCGLRPGALSGETSGGLDAGRLGERLGELHDDLRCSLQ